MEKSMITSRVADGKTVTLWRDNDKPKDTYAEIDGELTKMSVKDFLARYR